MGKNHIMKEHLEENMIENTSDKETVPGIRHTVYYRHKRSYGRGLSGRRRVSGVFEF